MLAFAVLLFAVIIPSITSAFSPSPNEGDQNDAALQQEAGNRVSFVAVGDNLPNEYIGYYANKLAGGTGAVDNTGVAGDEKYDYYPMFEPIVPYVQAADLSYINQETHLGGNDFGVQGYPAFNTTDEMADAVVKSGFDFVASATNHSYDWGFYGALDHSLSVWEKQPVAFTGTAVTAEQYNRIPQVERNGMKFALLNYTYGVNGYTQEQLPQYAVNFIDEQRIRQDVARARQEGADVILAAMHWGTENLTEADDHQRAWAQLLADLDVDLVIGSHPHVIGPMEWMENSNGSGHKTLVAYSLGNFLADHESPNEINVLEGMLSCDFVRVNDASEEEGGDGSTASAPSEGDGNASASSDGGADRNAQDATTDPKAAAAADAAGTTDAATTDATGTTEAADAYGTSEELLDEDGYATLDEDAYGEPDGAAVASAYEIGPTGINGTAVPKGQVGGDGTPNASGIRIENVKWTPLVCHSNANRDTFGVYAIEDYPEDLAKKNRVFTNEKDPAAWVWDTTKSIVGAGWF